MTRSGRQGWRPEAKRDRDVESSRPQAAGQEVSAVRSTDFMAGRGDCKGGRAVPFARSQVTNSLYSAEHEVNGTTCVAYLITNTEGATFSRQYLTVFVE
ncbi:hypothetical protein D3C76_1281110 [compost metagenome]